MQERQQRQQQGQQGQQRQAGETWGQTGQQDIQHLQQFKQQCQQLSQQCRQFANQAQIPQCQQLFTNLAISFESKVNAIQDCLDQCQRLEQSGQLQELIQVHQRTRAA